MRTALLSGGCALIGLVFSLTPIPFLPKIYWDGFGEFWKDYGSVGSLVAYGVLNLPWALVPLVFVLGMHSTSGLLPAIAFTAAMYASVICHWLLPSRNSID